MLVLVVEDDPAVRASLERSLEFEGYAVVSAPDGEAGLAAVAMHRPDLVLLDLGLPEGSTGSRSAGGCGRPGTASRCSCSRPGSRPATASAASTPAPTTTCPSRSPSRSCSPGCAPCCAGPGRRPAADKALVVERPADGRRRPRGDPGRRAGRVDPHRVRAARVPHAAPAPGAHPGADPRARCGATTSTRVRTRSRSTSATCGARPRRAGGRGCCTRSAASATSSGPSQCDVRRCGRGWRGRRPRRVDGDRRRAFGLRRLGPAARGWPGWRCGRRSPGSAPFLRRPAGRSSRSRARTTASAGRGPAAAVANAAGRGCRSARRPTRRRFREARDAQAPVALSGRRRGARRAHRTRRHGLPVPARRTARSRPSRCPGSCGCSPASSLPAVRGALGQPVLVLTRTLGERLDRRAPAATSPTSAVLARRLWLTLLVIRLPGALLAVLAGYAVTRNGLRPVRAAEPTRPRTIARTRTSPCASTSRRARPRRGDPARDRVHGDDRRARRRTRPAGPARRGRRARAAHPADQPAHEHRPARTQRADRPRRCRRRTGRRSWPTSPAQLDELSDLVSELVVLAHERAALRRTSPSGSTRSSTLPSSGPAAGPATGRARRRADPVPWVLDGDQSRWNVPWSTSSTTP